MPSVRLPASHLLSVAVIGNDMLLAALPSTPVQLAHACYLYGFEVVVPASWGDELVAHAVLEDLRRREREPVIQCTCPLVSERLLANGQHLAASMVQTASPPVAAARYARHALSPRPIHVTYIGSCPGAQHSAIDQRLLPDEFLRLLDERDIAIADMPTVFDSVLPPDRRRFVSLPGGCPTQDALWQVSDGRMLREVTQATFSTDLAQTLVWREYVMVDVAPSLGCACAGGYSRLGTRFGRVAVTALEPPRATQPVVLYQPELVALTIDDQASAQMRNGDEPDDRPIERQGPASGAAPGAGAAPEPAVDHTSPSRARVRAPSSSPLPRAYLAKRRHLAPVTKEVTPPLDAPAPTVIVDVAADNLQQDLMPNEPTSEPNESAPAALAEPADLPLPIAVHLEPEALPLEAPAVQPQPIPVAPDMETVANAPFSAAPALPPGPAPVAEIGGPFRAPLREEQNAQEAEEWGPPVAIASDEQREMFEPSTGPMRVEVEIYEDIAIPEPEAIVADVVRPTESLEPSNPVSEADSPTQRGWGDLLIAVWLVLVASAVIASLVWRR